MAPSFEESSGIGSPSPESVSQRIAVLGECSDMVDGVVGGVPIQDIISQLLEETCNPDQKAVQLQLIRVVTERLLNMKLRDGQEPRKAHSGQVEAIRRLAYGLGDTVLIARTGYGKSIIFQAIPIILRGKVIIQIIPLSKLGEEQRDTILTFPNTNPVLITDQVVKDKKFWESLLKPDITHILVGPEQATHHRFLSLLRNSEFNQRIAFIGIDELHTVHQWRGFREQYTKLKDLRFVVPRSILMFGCTATLTREAQAFVLQSVGFRPEGLAQGELQIIRTSVDRVNIGIIFQCLRRGETTDYRRLETFIAPRVDSVICKGGHIFKTIIYIDSRKRLITARRHLLQYLVGLGYHKRLAERIIRRYDATVRPSDQQTLYDDFRQTDSTCRVVLATVALGMGMDIPDVQQVVQFGALQSGDVADLVQRFGRAARMQTEWAYAYFFAPDWYFDRLGHSEDDPDPSTQNIPVAPTPSRRYETRVPSRLRECYTYPELDLESESEHSSSAATHSTAHSNARFVPRGALDMNPNLTAPPGNEIELDAELGLFGGVLKPKLWSRQDRVKRARFATNHPEMKALVNETICFRSAALEILQEPPHTVTGADRVPVPICCNACNPTMGSLPVLEKKAKGKKKPSKNSQVWFALQELITYAETMAQDLYPDVEVMFRIPPEVLMLPTLLNDLARAISEDGFAAPDIESLKLLVPALVDWDWLERHGAALVSECSRVGPIAKANWKNRPQKPKRAAKTARHDVYTAAGTLQALNPATPQTSFTSETTLVATPRGPAYTTSGFALTQGTSAPLATPHTPTATSIPKRARGVTTTSSGRPPRKNDDEAAGNGSGAGTAGKKSRKGAGAKRNGKKANPLANLAAAEEVGGGRRLRSAGQENAPRDNEA